MRHDACSRRHGNIDIYRLVSFLERAGLEMIRSECFGDVVVFGRNYVLARTFELGFAAHVSNLA